MRELKNNLLYTGYFNRTRLVLVRKKNLGIYSILDTLVHYKKLRFCSRVTLRLRQHSEFASNLSWNCGSGLMLGDVAGECFWSALGGSVAINSEMADGRRKTWHLHTGPKMHGGLVRALCFRPLTVVSTQNKYTPGTTIACVCNMDLLQTPCNVMSGASWIFIIIIIALVRCGTAKCANWSYCIGFTIIR